MEPKKVHHKVCRECREKFSTVYARKLTCSFVCAEKRKKRQEKRWREDRFRKQGELIF